MIDRLTTPIENLQKSIIELAAVLARLPEPAGVAALHGAIPAEETDAEFLAQIEAENAKGKPAPAVLMIPDMAKEATAEFCGVNPGRIYSIDVEKISAVVARRAIDELVKRYEAGSVLTRLRAIAAEMKGEK